VAFVFLNMATSLNMMSPISFFLKTEKNSIVHIYLYTHPHTHHFFLIQSSVVGHLGFHSLAIVNTPTINMGVQVSLLYPDYTPFSVCPGVVSLEQWQF
jgi:hypothetical protein